MKPIEINKEKYEVSAPIERIIKSIAAHGPAALSDFTQRRGRWMSNAAAQAYDLCRASAGAIEISYTTDDKLLLRQRPRVQRWIVPASKRRLNLVVKKLGE